MAFTAAAPPAAVALNPDITDRTLQAPQAPGQSTMGSLAGEEGEGSMLHGLLSEVQELASRPPAGMSLRTALGKHQVSCRRSRHCAPGIPASVPADAQQRPQGSRLASDPSRHESGDLASAMEGACAKDSLHRSPSKRLRLQLHAASHDTLPGRLAHPLHGAQAPPADVGSGELHIGRSSLQRKPLASRASQVRPADAPTMQSGCTQDPGRAEPTGRVSNQTGTAEVHTSAVAPADDPQQQSTALSNGPKGTQAHPPDIASSPRLGVHSVGHISDPGQQAMGHASCGVS